MSFAHTTPFSQPEQDRRSPFAHLRPNSAWYCYRARVQRKTPLTADQVAEGQRLAVADIDFVESETGMQPAFISRRHITRLIAPDRTDPRARDSSSLQQKACPIASASSSRCHSWL